MSGYTANLIIQQPLQEVPSDPLITFGATFPLVAYTQNHPVLVYGRLTNAVNTNFTLPPTSTTTSKIFIVEILTPISGSGAITFLAQTGQTLIWMGGATPLIPTQNNRYARFTFNSPINSFTWYGRAERHI